MPIVQISASITRPANTTAYNAGDVIADVTTNNHFIFSDALEPGANKLSGVIRNALINSSVNAGTKLDGELWIFSSDIAEVGDNVAFAVTDSEIANLLGVIDFPVASWKVGGGNAICQNLDLNLAIRGAGNTIYGVLIARNAYTPASGEIFTINLVIDR